MSNTISLSLNNTKIKTVVFDLIAVALITFLPAVSHLLSFPLYLLEPMRVLLILSIAHTSKKNTFLIALALPILSFIISSHPAVFKMLLVTTELTLNVLLFFYLADKFKNNFGALIASILISKIYYYAVKVLLISAGLIDGELVATPFYLQAIVMLVLGVYIYLMLDNKKKKA